MIIGYSNITFYTELTLIFQITYRDTHQQL